MKIIRMFYSLITPIIVSALLVIGIGWEESLNLLPGEHRMIGFLFVIVFFLLMNFWVSSYEQYSIRTKDEKINADKRKTNG